MAGAIAGMLGGAMMAMFTMIATVTYLHMGFFTPLYVIASPLSGPQSMMTAMHGGAFYFAFGPAILGLAVNMLWSALWGIIFGLIAAGLHLRSAAAIIGGMVSRPASRGAPYARQLDESHGKLAPPLGDSRFEHRETQSILGADHPKYLREGITPVVHDP